jgi:hypothetical protein
MEIVITEQSAENKVHERGSSNCLHGGFARDFYTADRERVMVAALTRRQFADLARITRRVGTLAFLERVLGADFSACGDLYVHRGAIALLLAPWFARRTVADVAAAFAGTSVTCARLTLPAGREPSDQDQDPQVERTVVSPPPASSLLAPGPTSQKTVL